MRSFPWLADDGWPYSDADLEVIDPAGDIDDDMISLMADVHLMDDLSPLERQVIAARFGLRGAPMRSMKELRADLHMPREDLRDAMGSGLAKLRAHMTA